MSRSLVSSPPPRRAVAVHLCAAGPVVEGAFDHDVRPAVAPHDGRRHKRGGRDPPAAVQVWVVAVRGGAAVEVELSGGHKVLSLRPAVRNQKKRRAGQSDASRCAAPPATRPKVSGLRGGCAGVGDDGGEAASSPARPLAAAPLPPPIAKERNARDRQ